MRIFEFNSYKKFLTAHIAASSRRGLISELAKAAGCTHSYLSQVLHGNLELTPDQAWALTEHLSLSNDEADYFLLLVLSERAASPRLKKKLESKLESLKAKQLLTQKAVSNSIDYQLKPSQRDRYYSSWITGAIHTLTSSIDYQTIEEISKRLSISPLEVENIISWLVENGLVKRIGNRFQHTGENIHLPTNSIHNQINHLNWRLRGVQGASKSNDIHYTSIFTISKADVDKLRAELIHFIETQRQSIHTSGSEEGYVFCCDLFRI
jgi:uncharacterized protein (TIGR02147 family)